MVGGSGLGFGIAQLRDKYFPFTRRLWDNDLAAYSAPWRSMNSTKAHLESYNNNTEKYCTSMQEHNELKRYFHRHKILLEDLRW